MINETNPCPMCKAHGYVEEWDSQELDALATAYQIWCDKIGAPQLSMGEQNFEALSSDEARTLFLFIDLWEALS